MIVSFLVMARLGYTWKERVFFAVAWTPKATVQAALSGVLPRACGPSRVPAHAADVPLCLHFSSAAASGCGLPLPLPAS